MLPGTEEGNSPDRRGGILSVADAVEKLDDGARMVRSHGLIYRGPELVSECVSAAEEIKDGEFASR